MCIFCKLCDIVLGTRNYNSYIVISTYIVYNLVKTGLKLIYFPISGIGRACAIALVETGADVVALSRTQADLDTLKQQVTINNV